MKNSIQSIFILVTLALLMQGCTSKQTKPSMDSVLPIGTYKSCPKDLYYRDEKESLRLQEQLKAYPIGRYVDPNNPNIMHEAHTIYRLEKPSKWNKNLHKPTVVPLGPTYALADPNQMKSPISEALEQALIAQTEMMQELHEHNQALLTRIELLEKEIHVSNDRNHPMPDAAQHRKP
jgi:hypothetical protein